MLVYRELQKEMISVSKVCISSFHENCCTVKSLHKSHKLTIASFSGSFRKLAYTYTVPLSYCFPNQAIYKAYFRVKFLYFSGRIILLLETNIRTLKQAIAFDIQVH